MSGMIKSDFLSFCLFLPLFLSLFLSFSISTEKKIAENSSIENRSYLQEYVMANKLLN